MKRDNNETRQQGNETTMKRDNKKWNDETSVLRQLHIINYNKIY